MKNFSQKIYKENKGVYKDPSAAESNKIVKENTVENPKEWEKQVWWWRQYLDIFIENYFSTEKSPVRFYDFQKVIVRECGNCSIVRDTEARSMGKTFKMSRVLAGLAILYPQNKILIVSNTVRQAILTVKYINDLGEENANFAREIIQPIKISKDGAKVKFKNGSEIEAMAMNKDGSNIRGERRKIIYIDESAWVMSSVIQSVLIPMLRYNRKVVENNRLKGLAFEDFSSKLIETSSAYLKSCDYYQRFKETIQDIRDGYKDRFCCALSYKTAVRCGIVEEDFVLEQKKKMPLSVWEMEWNSKFVGETEGSYFPYDLTEPCRDFSHVEIQQPKNSMSRYVLSLDVATSEDKKADNACITVIKIVPKNDGTYEKYIVFIRTYHGYSLEMLAEQVRITCCRFPNIIKVIIDANAIGEGVVSLLNIPYVDDLGREYPPLIKDTIEVSDSRKAINIISAIKADNKKNENMAVHTLLFLENHSLHIPIPSVKIRRQIEEQKIIIKDDTGTKRKISKEEVGVYIEADGLQMEMGNIVRIRTAAGNYLYDVKKSTQHKDRYSSLAMALDFIFSLEDKNRGDATENSGDNCWGRSMNF